MELVLALHHQWPWVWPVWGGILGAVLGSFGGCMVDRVQAGLGLRYPPSQCLNCHHTLGVLDLVPILSWLFLRGKCRYCRVKIPATLLVWESAGAALGAAVVWGIFKLLL